MPDKPMTVADVRKMLNAVTPTEPPIADGEPSGPEAQLEAETGHDVVKTGKEPPTFVETDKPAPKGKKAD